MAKSVMLVKLTTVIKKTKSISPTILRAFFVQTKQNVTRKKTFVQKRTQKTRAKNVDEIDARKKEQNGCLAINHLIQSIIFYSIHSFSDPKCLRNSHI